MLTSQGNFNPWHKLEVNMKLSQFPFSVSSLVMFILAAVVAVVMYQVGLPAISEITSLFSSIGAGGMVALGAAFFIFVLILPRMTHDPGRAFLSRFWAARGAGTGLTEVGWRFVARFFGAVKLLSDKVFVGRKFETGWGRI